jgi:hypothetical protein
MENVVQVIEADKGNLKKVLGIWYATDKKSDAVEAINREFGVNFEYGTWSRYIKAWVAISNMDISDDEVLAEKQLQLDLKIKTYQNKNMVLNRNIRNFAKGMRFYQDLSDNVELGDYVPEDYYSDAINSDLPHYFIGDVHHEGNEDCSELFKKAIRLVDRSDEDYVLVFPGDLIQGQLRTSDLLNSQSVSKQINTFCNDLVETLNPEGNCKKIVILPGNHDRVNIFKDLYHKDADSFAYIIAGVLEGKLNIPITLTWEYNFIHNDENYLVTHGDWSRGKNKIIEYYRNFDGKVIHAHYHHHYVQDNVIGLPALAKGNAYEKSLGLQPNVSEVFVIKDGFYKCLKV